MKITHLARGLALAAVLAPAAARAGSDLSGTTAASFLSLGTDPAMLARGGATLGMVSGIGATPWNPAALGFMKETQIALSHATFIDSHTQDYLAAGGRFGGSPVHWALSGLYESEGSFAGRDANNISTGDFNVGSFAGGAHVAMPIAGVAAFGIGGKWVNQSLGSATRGAGFTFDMGVQAHAGPIGFGAAAQNAFGQMRFGSQSYDFPTNYGVGVAVEPPGTGLRIALDANFPKSYYQDVRGGVEWRWHDLVALRAGYRKELGAPDGDMLSGPTFGMGAGVYGMWFDYGYVVPATGEPQHRIGLTLRPGHMNLNALRHSAGNEPPAGDETSAAPRHPLHATAAPAPTGATATTGGTPGAASATPSSATGTTAGTTAPATPGASGATTGATRTIPTAIGTKSASTSVPKSSSSTSAAARSTTPPTASPAGSAGSATRTSAAAAAGAPKATTPTATATPPAATATPAMGATRSGNLAARHKAPRSPKASAGSASAPATAKAAMAAAGPNATPATAHKKKKKQKVEAQAASTGQEPDPFQQAIERAKESKPDDKDRLKK